MTPSPSDMWTAELPGEIQDFVQKLQSLPDFPLQLARYSQVLKNTQPQLENIAGLLAERARRIGNDAPVWHATEWHYRNHVRRWHFSILQDTARNDIYSEALRRQVRPGMVVLEIGTGSGILAMLAAQAGAKHVYTCEMEPLVAEAARENIRRNGLADRITVIEKKSFEVQIGSDLPEPADLMVSEIVNNHLLGEHILPIMEDTWARLLKPEAIVLPDQVELRGALVGGFPWTYFSRTPEYCGLDLSALNPLASAQTDLKNPDRARLDDAISDDVTVLHFDFSKPRLYPAEEREFSIRARRNGVADAFVDWIWLRFGSGLEFSNRPPCESAWCPQIHAFPKSLPLVANQEVIMKVRHDRETPTIWNA